MPDCVHLSNNSSMIDDLKLRDAAGGLVAAVIGGRNFDAVLGRSGLSGHQRAAAMDLAYGTLRACGRGDFLLARLLDRPLTDTAVRALLLVALARLESQASLDALVAMTTGTTEAWLARRAVEMIASSGDPRAHDHLRTAAERSDLTEEARVAAINGLAGSYATSRDAEYLRGLYARVNSDRLRDAIMGGIATIGGKVSRDWILGVARDNNAAIAQRKRAVSMADRLGLSAADLSSLYDAIEDGDVRASLIQQLRSNGTRAATDKLVAIAKSDPLLANRRRAIQALGQFDDPRVKEALRELVGKV